MNTILRDDQQYAVDTGVAWVKGGKKAALLLTGPTGSGKSYVLNALHEILNRENGLHYTVAPTHEIAWAMYCKATGPSAVDSPKLQERVREVNGYWTVKRLYNVLQCGTAPLPKSVSFDEGHHSVDTTHQTVWALCGFPPRVDVTATAYRGTPVETAKLRASYERIVPFLTLKDAVDRRVIARPDFTTWPLLDDHTIDVVNGEFVVKQVDAAVNDKLVDLVARVGEFYDGYRYDRPTMLTFSSVAQCRNAVSVFRQSGLPAIVVVGESDPLFESDRQQAFRRVVEREVILIQIAVVGEGVDLPIRRLIDVAPTMSPTRWMQRVGRVTRPTDVPPEVISCCHNFTRHSYLWHGVLPAGVVKQNQQVWGKDFKLTRRDMSRALGLEGFGRFQVNHVPLADGSCGALYALQTKDGMDRYAVYLGPDSPEPYFFHQHFEYTGETDSFEKNGMTIEYKVKTRPSWKRIDAMPDLQECVSIKPDAITPKMLSWWRGERGMRGAAKVGLDHEHTPNAREFQILPIVCNTGLRLS